jgi:hypothetical protein
MTRFEKIDAGKIWHVYKDGDIDNILFEGCRSKCLAFINEHFGMRSYKNGIVRLGKIIWEIGM